MPDMTNTTMATWIPAVWSRVPTITYRSNTILTTLMDRTWEKEVGIGQGDRVNIPGFTQNSSASNRGAGTGTFGTGATTTFSAVTEAQLQLIVNRYYYKAFRQAVESTAQIMPNYNVLLLQGHGKAVALAVDADLAGDNSNGIDAFTTTVGGDNVDITEDDMLTVETNINAQNAPVNDRYLVLSPASATSVRKIDAVRNSLYSSAVGVLPGDRALGAIGRYNTFEVYMSNNLEAGTAGKKNGGFQREAIAYAEQMMLRTEKTFNIQDGGLDQYLTFFTCGFLIIKNAYGNELDGK